MTDNELIYLTKTEGLKSAKLILNNKYLTYINNLQRKFSINKYISNSTYIENLSNAYITLNECLKDFNIKQNSHNFGQKITLTCKSIYKNDIRKHTSYKRRLQNRLIEYENLFENNKANDEAIDVLQERLMRDQKIKIIKDYLKNKPMTISKVVNLKLEDYG
jgi:hypothetical protein